MKSIGSYLAAAEHRPSGFDYMRLTLALAVLVTHSVATSEGQAVMQVLWRIFPLGGVLSLILPMFFALSGFLVAGSMDRSRTVISFMGLRALRIYPALTIDILLTALVIGPLMTSLDLAAYVRDPLFFSYLANVTGHDIAFQLPGVFADNPGSAANGQLWTVPYELYSYALLGACMVIGLKFNRRLIILIATAVLAAGLIANDGMRTDWAFTNWYGAVSGKMLVVSFMLGVNLYLWREQIPCGPFLVLAALLASILTFSFAPGNRIFGVFPAALLTVYLGVLNPPRNFLLRGADISYGIFLYHFAFQQVLIALMGGNLHWYWVLGLSLPITVLFAYASWFLVEKPALALRKPLEKWEDKRLAWRARRTAKTA